MGRYGTTAGSGNDANYLIDSRLTVLTLIHERRAIQDKVEIPASVPRRVGSGIAPVPVSGSVLKGRASISVPVGGTAPEEPDEGEARDIRCEVAGVSGWISLGRQVWSPHGSGLFLWKAQGLRLLEDFTRLIWTFEQVSSDDK